jgi:uncharacterized protein (DUF433 family)
MGVVPDPDLRIDAPVFRGTTLPVRALFVYMAGRYTLDDFLTDFPSVSRDLAVQCIDDAKQLLLASAAAAPEPARNLLRLLELRGIGKEMFAALGGGENFIRSERRAFARAIEKQDRERRLL